MKRPLRSEYRINKKGAECFRTEFYEEAREKLEELRSRRPNIRYEMQIRHAEYDYCGKPRYDWKGRRMWSIWQDMEI